MPDETNLHRTLNLAWPYGRKRRAAAKKPTYPRPLAASDEALSDEKLVEMGWARPENSVKRIEQCGKLYEQLKQKYAKLSERM